MPVLQMPKTLHLAAARRAPRAFRFDSPVGSSRRAFETLPHGYLILDRDFTIVDVNPAYARLTMTDPGLILGRDIFDVFPDNPGDPLATGVKKLTASLKKVIEKAEQDTMPWQRYDISDRTGIFVERHWDPTNCPILDDNGEVEFIVHHVADVTNVAKRFLASHRASSQE